MDHFWREVSYDNVNLTGSVVAGWYDLPRPRSDYVFDDRGMPGISFDGLAQDCTGVADADVFFPDFAGVHLIFNDSLDCCAWGGGHVLDRDGQVKSYNMTWMPPFAYENQSVMGHEMGHGFGLPHSSGPYATPYDSKWDVMSTGGICSPSHAEFGCLGVHTVAHHMDLMGWIPPSRQYVAIDGSRQSITLEPLGGPVSDDGYLMAKIPIAGSDTEFYTVEARRFLGYDDQIPGEAILINHVDSTRGDRQSQVVDPDGNGDPNDGAAMWLPGETFTDDAHDITISVDGSSPSGIQVTLSSGAACGFSIDPTTAFFAVDGGAGVVTVTADARCDWTAESHAAWIHVDSPSAGAGDGIITYIVDVNPGSARSATMTIAGLTFSVEQEGSFNLPPSCVDAVADGGFEDGTPSQHWSEFSSNFLTPLCDGDTCGSAFARTGDWYLWLGGFAGGVEESAVEQTLTIPRGSATLKFSLWIPTSSGNGVDFARVLLDGIEVFSVLEGAPAYAGGYVQVERDVSTFGDDGTHRLRIESRTTGFDAESANASSSFFIDDVALESCPAEDVDLDLDIARFKVTRAVRLGSGIVHIKMLVRSRVKGEGARVATVVGVQNRVEVYRESLLVAPEPRRRASYEFPSYTPIDRGTIRWTATIVDEYPDRDKRKARTRVRRARRR